MVPILVINDFDLFNNLLVQYVDMSLNYYKDEPYFQELDELDDSFFFINKKWFYAYYGAMQQLEILIILKNI